MGPSRTAAAFLGMAVDVQWLPDVFCCASLGIPGMHILWNLGHAHMLGALSRLTWAPGILQRTATVCDPREGRWLWVPVRWVQLWKPRRSAGLAYITWMLRLLLRRGCMIA